MTGHNTLQTAPSIRTIAGKPSETRYTVLWNPRASIWLNAVCSHAQARHEANMNTCWGMCPRGTTGQKMHAHQKGGISTTTRQPGKTRQNLLVMQTASQAQQQVHEHLLRPQSQKDSHTRNTARAANQLKKRGPFLLLAGNRSTRAYHGTTLLRLPYTRSLKAAGMQPWWVGCCQCSATVQHQRGTQLLWGHGHVSTGGVRQHLLSFSCHPA